jgi:hypothetical protein
MPVPVAPAGFGRPQELFELPRWVGRPIRANCDIASDGQRSVMIRTPEASPHAIHDVVNWPEELKQRVPR